MPAEAHVTPVWKKQKLFVAIFLFGVGGWFFWDGFVGYPHSNKRWLAHDELVKKGEDSKWPEVAKGKNWTEEVPHKLMSDNEIVAQKYFGSLAALLGLVSFAYWFTQKDRVLRTDAEAVYSPAGTRIPFEAITGLGKRDWEKKGYATILYTIDGRKGRFLLDDYKFDRDATHQVLAEIEEKLLARTNS